MLSGVKAQEILVELGVHCLSFVDFIDFNLKAHYFEILNLIFHRGELDLAQAGFLHKESESMSRSVIDSKKKVSVKYQYFIYDSLRY